MQTDWVNDLVLCNLNQTREFLSLIYPVDNGPETLCSPCSYLRLLRPDDPRVESALDRELNVADRDWTPHRLRQMSGLLVSPLFPPASDLFLTPASSRSREQHFVASGGFDRQVKLWDINHPTSSSTPLLTLNHAEVSKEKSSIYSLATTPSGNVVAAGSPERVIRVWDPRAGGKRICKLVGHTDNIRALLVSEDGKHVSATQREA